MDNNNELMTNITAMVQNYIDDQLKSSQSKIVQLNSELENAKTLYSHSLSSNVNEKIMNEETHKRYQNTVNALSTSYSLLQLYRTKLTQCIDLFKKYNIPYSDAIIDNHFLQMEQSLLNSLNDSYLYETTGSFKQRSPLASSKQLSSMETNSSLPTSSGTKKEPTNPSALHHYTSNLYTNLTVPTGPTRDSTTFSPIHKSPSYSAVNDPSHPAALSTHSAGDSEDLLQSSFSSSSKRTLEAPDYIPIYPQASLKRPLGSSSTPDTTRMTTTPPSAPHLPYLNGTMNSIMKSNLVENLKNSETILSRYQDRSDKDVHPSAFNPYPDPHSITSSWKGPTYESKSTNDNSSTPKRLKYGPDTNPFGTPPSDSKRQSINSVVFPSKDNSKDGSL